MTWAAVASIGVASFCTFFFVAFEAIWGKKAPQNWCISVADKHYAAIFGTPAAVSAAFSLLLYSRLLVGISISKCGASSLKGLLAR